ncbi:MAG TPA: MauE/DoxX family redox-associated membrane protein, partial [Acidimicrobiales bacterium]|nr:MauE/DoxX family redox-associated membrane protein [Acidimicrobiales bacterium]
TLLPVLPALAAAGLLVAAGAAKVVDPSRTVGALRALHLPASDRSVRAGAAAEATLGAAALAVGGTAWWALVGASYVAFAAFVATALRAGTAVGTCGCFGGEDTPPRASHVVVDLLLAAAALGAARAGSAPLTAVLDEPGPGAAVALLATGVAALAHGALTRPPRTAGPGDRDLAPPGRAVRPGRRRRRRPSPLPAPRSRRRFPPRSGAGTGRSGP